MAKSIKPKNSSYEVGYGKPPEASKFKPGISGNPKGRPKGRKNFDTLMAEELESKIEITEGGQRKTVTRLEAVTKTTVNSAMKGNLRAIQVVLQHSERRSQQEQQQDQKSKPLTADDQAIITAFLERQNGNQKNDPS